MNVKIWFFIHYYLECCCFHVPILLSRSKYCFHITILLSHYDIAFTFWYCFHVPILLSCSNIAFTFWYCFHVPLAIMSNRRCIKNETLSLPNSPSFTILRNKLLKYKQNNIPELSKLMFFSILAVIEWTKTSRDISQYILKIYLRVCEKEIILIWMSHFFF